MERINIKYSYIDHEGCLLHIEVPVPIEIMETASNFLQIKPMYLEMVGLKSSQVKNWQVEVEDD